MLDYGSKLSDLDLAIYDEVSLFITFLPFPSITALIDHLLIRLKHRLTNINFLEDRTSNVCSELICVGKK